MCGRYAVFDEEDNMEIRRIIKEIDERFIAAPEKEAMRIGEIFPTNVAPVLLPSPKGGFQAAPLRWGYPRFDGPGVVINARSETAGSKNMFRSSLANKRCLIPASGFFEWKGNGLGGKKKDKYWLHYSDASIMYLAGLYQSFQDPKTGSSYTAFVILTTGANPSMRSIHDRMPVIIGQEDIFLWLNDHKSSKVLLEQEGPVLMSSIAI